MPPIPMVAAKLDTCTDPDRIEHGISVAQTVASESSVPERTASAAATERSRQWDPIAYVIDKTFRPGRYWLGVVLSIAYLFVLTYLMMDAVGRFATISQIPSRFDSLVIVAIAANLPSTIGGVVSAKHESSADMAVCSSFGSNIFSVLVGMGFPWLLRIATGKEVHLPGVRTELPSLSILLAVQISVFVLILGLAKLRLSRMTGFACLAVYTAYTVLAALDFM